MSVALTFDYGGCIDGFRGVLGDVGRYGMRSELGRAGNRSDFELPSPPHVCFVALSGNAGRPRSLSRVADRILEDIVVERSRRRRKMTGLFAEPIEPHHDMEMKRPSPLVLSDPEVRQTHNLIDLPRAQSDLLRERPPNADRRAAPQFRSMCVPKNLTLIVEAPTA
jgi:hypothetical protein